MENVQIHVSRGKLLKMQTERGFKAFMVGKILGFAFDSKLSICAKIGTSCGQQQLVNPKKKASCAESDGKEEKEKDHLSILRTTFQ